MPGPPQPSLVRAIGRWSLAALMVNSIIGSGVFGLPSSIAGLVGSASPWAVLLAGLAVGVIMACYAEVASQFSEAGGPYLYARAAFGRFFGIETGWLLWLARLTAPAANANLFVVYLGEFWPHAKDPVPRLAILTALIGVLVVVNLIGVRAGTQVSNIFTVGKLVPLFAVAIGGIFFFATGHGITPIPAPAAPAGTWLKAILLLVFAYGGFESALTPAAEVKNPRKDAAFALLSALALCTLLYTAIQWTVVRALADPAHASRPLADVARYLFGPAGAAIVSIGALISIYGYLSANLLAVPRITFALAEGGDFPRFFAAIHSRFRTPYISILIFGFLTWELALLANFEWNVTLSAVARLFYYGLVCAALPVLRRKQPDAAEFRLPGGVIFAVLGVMVCLVLGTRVDHVGSYILGGVVFVGFVNWLVVRKNTLTGGASPASTRSM
ncbi:MAG TPA: APC family permease [Terriglobales bacterium]|nr:APC family permease [Terriglobales bacterium]